MGFTSEQSEKTKMMGEESADRQDTLFQLTEQDVLSICRDIFHGRPVGKTVSVTLLRQADGEEDFIRLIETEGGKVVYKPRDAYLDQHLGSLLLNLFPNRLRTPKSTTVGDHSFQEYIHAFPARGEAEAEELFFNMGIAVALSSVLGSVDIKTDNFMSEGSSIVMPDVEMLFSPWSRRQRDAINSGDSLFLSLQTHMGQSISDSTIFERFIFSRCKPHEQASLFRNTTIDSILPYIGGRRVPALEYWPTFSDGFISGCCTLRDNAKRVKQFLSDCSDVFFRVNPRNFDLYTWIHEHLHTPEEIRQCLTEHLPPAYRAITAELIEEETRCLSAGYFPRFSTMVGSHDLYCGGAVLVPEILELTAAEQVRKNLSALSDQDIEDQLRFLHATVECELLIAPDLSAQYDKRMLPCSDISKLTQEDCLREADEIFRYLVERKLVFPDGYIGWLGLSEKTKNCRLAVLDGESGIRDFLAQYAEIRDSGEARSLLKELDAQSSKKSAPITCADFASDISELPVPPDEPETTDTLWDGTCRSIMRLFRACDDGIAEDGAARAISLASAMLARKRRLGSYLIAPLYCEEHLSAGFLRGLAGIGWTWLRVAERLPS